MNTTKVKDLFNGEVFTIPIYQRDYAWGEENFKDLWEDLLENHEMKESEHFLGTVVLTTDSKKSHLIDGQQRVTTLFMLLYCLNEKCSDSSYRKRLLYTANGDIKLQVSIINAVFFQKLLDNENPKPETLGQKNLLKVYEEIHKTIESYKKEQIDAYLEILENMNVLILTESNDGRAIRIFQSVNDRGVTLSNVDKLKSLLIYYSNRYLKEGNSEIGLLDNDINNAFGEIFKNYDFIKENNKIDFIDNRFKEDNILRYHYLSYSKSADYHYKTTIDESYDKIKKHLKNISKESKDELYNYIKDYTEDLCLFFQAFKNLIELTENDLELYQVLTILQPSTTLYPLIIRAYMKEMLNSELLTLIKLLDIQAFKMGYSPEKDTLWLTHQLDQGEDIILNIIQMIRFQKNRWDISKEFSKDVFRYNLDLYRFIFLDKEIIQNEQIGQKYKTLENIKKLKDLNLTVEHIFPQNGLSKVKDYGFKTQDDYEEYLNHYGNTMLLERAINSSVQDKDLVGKQDGYKKSKIEFVKLFSYSSEYLEFSKKTIKERDNELELYFTKLFSVLDS